MRAAHFRFGGYEPEHPRAGRSPIEKDGRSAEAYVDWAAFAHAFEGSIVRQEFSILALRSLPAPRCTRRPARSRLCFRRPIRLAADLSLAWQIQAAT